MARAGPAHAINATASASQYELNLFNTLSMPSGVFLFRRKAHATRQAGKPDGERQMSGKRAIRARNDARPRWYS
jgi:hypothetical protein